MAENRPIQTDNEGMCRALRLAALARHASPNPAVGCVLVGANGVVVGQGYTQPPGQAHAEAMALRDAGERARGATAYVTLEPCAHFGRTPPCANALVAAGVARVVAAMTDPDTRVAGQGVDILRAHGIEVTVGVCETNARALNAAYLKQRTVGMPSITLKTAMTLDGKIATRTGDSQWITSPIARKYVHRLRDRCDVILTGVGTVLADNPALTTRLTHKIGRNPWRVVVDSQARTPLESQVVHLGSNDGKTIIATLPNAESARKDAFTERGCLVWECEPDTEGRVHLPILIRRLGTETPAIGVLVEAGSELAAGLWKNELVDRWLAFIAPKIIGGQGAPGPIGGQGLASMAEARAVSSWTVRRCGSDILIDARFG